MVPWQLLSDWILFGTSIWFLGKPLRTFTAQGVLLLLHAFGSLPHLMAVNGSSIHPTLHKLLNIQPAIQPLNFHRVSKSPLVSVQFFTSLSVSVRLSTNPAQSLSACPTLNQLLSVSLTVHQPCIQTSNKIPSMESWGTYISYMATQLGSSSLHCNVTEIMQVYLIFTSQTPTKHVSHWS